MNNLYLVLILVLLISYYIYTCISENLENNKANNILGTPMIPCCATGKVTGFYRDGNCSTGDSDTGTHVVCAVMDDNFLQFTKTKGNDLSTPQLPSFPGLVAGDKWCLCILRWLEAYKAGKAPKIIPESTNEVALKYTTKDILLKYS
jgi:uncharacterized protein (DUF2237 family)